MTTEETSAVSAVRGASGDRLREGPILSTLIAFAAPNAIALCSSAIITVCETAYVGRLGVAALAGVALVFPIIMLMQMMSAGAMGGAISGAISRALGAGDVRRAEDLALAALVIGAVAGLGFAVLIWFLGPGIFRMLGGRGDALQIAVFYSSAAAFAIVSVWLANTMASVSRGAGGMTAPAVVLLGCGFVQIALGGALTFGLGGLPRLGVAGVACGQIAAFTLAAAAMFFYLRSRARQVRLRFDWGSLRLEHFRIILSRGAIAALSPIQSVATILILTALVARFGAGSLAGYGIGTRLEFLLIPLAFSIGVGAVPMVGASIGGGDVPRARRIAWVAAGLSAVALAIVSALVMLAPDLWARLFVSDGPALEAARLYLRIGGLGFPFFGLSLCLYFASQGAGKVIGPILAQALRLAIIIGGGMALLALDAPLWAVFALSAVAMTAQGLATAAAVKWTPWDGTR